MKKPHSSLRTALLNAALLTAITHGTALQAGTLYWDTNGDTAGSGNAGGTWDAGTNWTTDSTGSIAGVGWTNGESVVFSAGTDGLATRSVTLAGAVATPSVVLEETGLVNLTGGSIDITGGATFDSSALGVTTGRSMTWTSAIIGTGGLTLAVNGDTSATGGSSNTVFSLTGSNSFTGDVTITSGIVSAAANFGDVANKVILNGGGLVDPNLNLAFTRNLEIGASGGVIRNYGTVTNFRLQGTLGGSGELRRTDGGTTVLTGDGTGFTGAFNVQRGTMQIGNGTTTSNPVPNATGITIGEASVAATFRYQLDGSFTLAAPVTFNNVGSSIQWQGTGADDVMTINSVLGAGTTLGNVRVNSGAITLASGADVKVNNLALTSTPANNASAVIGTLNIEAGAQINSRYFNIGDGVNTAGAVNQSGGAATLEAGSNGFRVGHWNQGALTPGSVYNLSGGSLDATALAANIGTARFINIGWDGLGTMTVGGGAGTATLKAAGIQIDANGDSPTYNSSLSVASNGRVEIGSLGALSASANDRILLDGGSLVATANSTWSAAMVANTASTFDVDGFNPILGGNITGSAAINLIDTFTGGTLLLGGGTANTTIAAALSGSVAISKTGTGTVTLSGTSPYTGTATVSAGALSITGSFGGNLGLFGGTLSITGSTGGNVIAENPGILVGEGSIGGNLTLGNATPATLIINPTTPAALAVTGNVTLTGANAVVFSVPPTTTGTITVLTYSGALTGTPGTDLVLANSGNYRTATWTDTGSAITLSLSNKNLSWTGSAGGTWDLGTTASWTDGSPSSFYWGDNVTFPDLASNQTIAMAGGNLAPASMTFNADTTEYVITASGSNQVTGSIGFLKSGSGLLTMGGANAYTGGTILSKGQTRVRATGALGTGTVTLGDANTGSSNVSLYLDNTARVNFNTPVVVSNNGTGTMTLGSRTTVSGTGDNNQFTNISLQRDVIFDANAFDRTDFETISGTGNITINGTGRALFMTANTFAGNLTINNTNVLGLQLGTNSAAFNAIPDATNVTINAGGTLSLSYTAGGSETIAGLNGAGIVRNNGGNANTLIVGSGNASGSFSGTINNVSGVVSFTKTGSGTQTLSGVNSAYTGTTTISGGVLEAAALASIGTNSSIGAASATTGNIVFGAAAATLRYTGVTNVSTDRGFTLSSGTTGAGGTLEASGLGSWTIPAAIALNYGTVDQARTLTIGGTGTAANTYAGTITNNGIGITNVVKSGTGAWALSANNSFTGPLSITGGKLNLSFIGNGGAASQVGQSPKAGANLLLNGGTLAYTGISATTDRGFATGASGGSIEVPTGVTLAFGSTSAAFALGGTLTKTGLGTLNLVNYTGSTATTASDIVINEGVVNFGSGYFNASPFGYRALAITVNPTGVLRTSTSHALGGDNVDAGTSWGQVRLIGGEWNNNGDQYIAGGSVSSEGRLVMQAGLVSGTGQIRSANAAGGSVITTLPASTSSFIQNTGGTSVGFAAMTFDVADGSATSDLVVSNIISGGNGIAKTGPGLMLLSGINTYTGSTTVSAGTLELADNARLRFVIPATGAGNKLTGAGTATIKGDFAIDIAAAAALTSGTWVLEDATTASYDTTFSVVTPAGTPWTDAGGDKWTTPGAVSGSVWTFDEATGTLVLAIADAYGSWETANGIAGAGSNVDSDLDGIPNGIEFVIGGDPSGPGSDSSALLPTVTVDATYLNFVFRLTDDAASYDPFVQYGTTLAGWTAAEAGVDGVLVNVENDFFAVGTDRVTVRIPTSLSAPGARLFTRLRVDIP